MALIPDVDVGGFLRDVVAADVFHLSGVLGIHSGRLRRASPPSDRSDDVLEFVGAEGGTDLDVAIYQTGTLLREQGRSPERSVAKYLARELGRAGYNGVISRGYEGVPDRTYRRAGDVELWRWTLERRPYEARNVNLLLHDGDGGGQGALGGAGPSYPGPYAVAPGRNIGYELPLLELHGGDGYRNLRAALHEVGHLLGGEHKDRMMPAPQLTFQNLEDGWMNSPAP